ncbi:hypothetical protein V6N11_011026 [Hibiscus sabdariffa]|uniref:Uncharacterized protein n=1 Tax=Hibiscus sabdariffa TaxID=183260 RepID=A0ABR2S6Z3_9ROSI
MDQRSQKPCCFLGFTAILRIGRENGDSVEMFLKCISRPRHWFVNSFDLCTNGEMSVVTTLNCWRMFELSGRIVKGKVYKEKGSILLRQSGLPPAWHLLSSKFCFQGLLVPAEEVTAGEKQWFSSGCFCAGLGSRVLVSFLLIFYNEMLIVHDISWLYPLFSESVSDHALLSWLMKTNGRAIACPTSHLVGVDFLIMGKIIFSRILQRVTSNPLAISGIKGILHPVGPFFDFDELHSAIFKAPISTYIHFAASSLLFDSNQGEWNCKTSGGPHESHGMQTFASFGIAKGYWCYFKTRVDVQEGPSTPTSFFESVEAVKADDPKQDHLQPE